MKLVSETNIYISSVGTGLMLHPFLRPGSIVINLGVKKSKIKKYNYESYYWESYMCESTSYLNCDYYDHNKYDTDDNINEQYLKKLIKNNIKLVNNFNYPVKKFSNLPKQVVKFINYCKDNDCKETIEDMNSFNIDK